MTSVLALLVQMLELSERHNVLKREGRKKNHGVHAVRE